MPKYMYILEDGANGEARPVGVYSSFKAAKAASNIAEWSANFGVAGYRSNCIARSDCYRFMIWALPLDSEAATDE